MERLHELNLAVIRWLLGAFGMTTPVRCASEWGRAKSLLTG